MLASQSFWQRQGQYVAGLLVCALLGWFAFVQDARVPLLSGADLGFHELGHFVMYPLPVGDLVTAAMGSIFQVVIPWGLAGYFLAIRRDTFGGVFCLAWSSTSLQNVGVYIADAPHQALPLIGGGQHDWAYILGPREFDAIERADDIAGAVDAVGMLMLLGAVAICVLGLWFNQTSSSHH
ncbi:MAG TPA: hypothetical protein VNC78_12495 [Actinomycetota bacterium]|nr:hypothetical protein [Actinomycetota bacterium]